MSNAPSTAYRRHHDIEAPRIDDRAFRQGWTVVTRLDGLLAAGQITPGAWQAAALWGRWSERTGAPVVSAWRPRVDGGSPAGERTIGNRQIDAASKLRGCAAALGPERVVLLRMCIVEDLSWRALAGRLGVSCTTAKKRTVEAIVALERHLARGA